MDVENMKKILGDAFERAEVEEELNKEDKAVAEKAAKLIARDYGEVLKRLEDE